MATPGIFKPGTKIGSLLIERQLGIDSSGEIYSAIVEPVKTPVVVRVLSPEISANRARLQQIVVQLKAFTACRHAHLEQVVGFNQVATNQRWLLVTAPGSGVPLTERIASKDLSPPEVVAIMKQTLAGMQHAHDLNFLHGDLNLGNIWIDGSGKVKVANFAFIGVALTDRKARAEFQAPELLRAGEPNVLTDIYSLGVVFRKLFQAVGVARFTVSVRRVAERMSTQDPAQRFQAMADALELLGNPASDDVIADAHATIARDFEKSKTIQLTVDSEIRRARVRSRMPSPITLVFLAAVIYFGVTKVKPFLEGKDLKKIFQGASSHAVQAARTVSGVQKFEDTTKHVTDVKNTAEADMVRRTSAIDAVFDDEPPPPKQ